MKVGFIGLGNMGSAMAGSLLKAGHELAVYNRTPDKAKPLVEKGARKTFRRVRSAWRWRTN
jgi:3-hydroxyisobutyrate dehydrogenase-like beta-hydroxyacid dehydrogenase